MAYSATPALPSEFWAGGDKKGQTEKSEWGKSGKKGKRKDK